MKPLSELIFATGDWAPAIIVALFWILAAPVRILALMLLPNNSCYEWHLLYKCHKFFDFDVR